MNTGAVLFANNASARLKIATDAVSPTISVEDGYGAKFPQPLGDGSNWFMVTVEDRRTHQIEIMKCTARAGDIMTVTRAQEGTIAQDFLQYAAVVNRMTAGMMATFFEFNGYSIPEADDRFINAAGDEMFGPLILPPGPPADPEHAANKQYVDDVSIDEAPTDGRAYARSMVDWTPIGTGLAEAPNDGLLYGRGSLDWHETVPKPAFDAEVASTDAEITALDGRVDTLEVTVGTHSGDIADLQTTNTTQNSSIAALQATDVTHTSDITALDGRMDAVEADGISQDDRLDAVEAKNTAQDAAIATKIGDAPNDANAYVRAAAAWALGVLKSTYDAFVTATNTALGLRLLKAGDTMTGNLIIEPAAATPQFALKKPAGSFYNIIAGLTGNSTRWQFILGDNAAESGANAGSNFVINRYSDAAAFIDTVLGINRASGITTLKQLAVTTGPITVAGLPLVGGASMSDGPPAGPVNGQFWLETDTGNLFVFWVDAGGGAGQWVQVNIAPANMPPVPPSDGGEYMMVNGVWRLKSQTFKPVGASAIIPIPPTAKLAKINAVLIQSAASAGGMRWSLDGTTFPAGATDYTYSGQFMYGGSTVNSKGPAANIAYLPIYGAHDVIATPVHFQGELAVAKQTATNASYFTMHSRSVAFGGAATLHAQEYLLWCHHQTAFVGATQLAAFQLYPLTGGVTYTAGTTIEVEWIY